MFTDVKSSAARQLQELKNGFTLTTTTPVMSKGLELVRQALQLIKVARDHLEEVEADLDLISSTNS